MFVFALIGSIFVILSVFTMFGTVLSISGYGSAGIVNVFEAAFGQNYSGQSVTGMVFLLISVFASAVLGVILFIKCLVNHGPQNKRGLICTLMGFNTLNIVLCLCTKAFFGLEEYYDVQLGVAPILCIVVNLVSLSMFIPALVLQIRRSKSKDFGHIKVKYNSDKADNLIKYKKLLDNGAITKKEYEKIKKDIIE